MSRRLYERCDCCDKRKDELVEYGDTADGHVRLLCLKCYWFWKQMDQALLRERLGPPRKKYE